MHDGCLLVGLLSHLLRLLLALLLQGLIDLRYLLRALFDWRIDRFSRIYTCNAREHTKSGLLSRKRLRAVVAQCHATQKGLIAKGAIVVVHQQETGRGVAGNEDIGPPIVIHIEGAGGKSIGAAHGGYAGFL